MPGDRTNLKRAEVLGIYLEPAPYFLAAGSASSNCSQLRSMNTSPNIKKAMW